MSGLNAAAVRAIAKGLRPTALAWRWYNYTARGGGRWLPADAGHETPGVEITDAEGFVGWCPIDGIARLAGANPGEWLGSGSMSQADVELAVRLVAEAASAPKVREGAHKSSKAPPLGVGGLVTADGWHAYAVTLDGKLLVRQPHHGVYNREGPTVRWPVNPKVLGRGRLDDVDYNAVRPKGWPSYLREKVVTVTVSGDGAGTIAYDGTVRPLDEVRLEPGAGSSVTVAVPADIFLLGTERIIGSQLELAVVRRGSSLWLHATSAPGWHLRTGYEAYLANVG